MAIDPKYSIGIDQMDAQHAYWIAVIGRPHSEAITAATVTIKRQGPAANRFELLMTRRPHVSVFANIRWNP